MDCTMQRSCLMLPLESLLSLRPEHSTLTSCLLVSEGFGRKVCLLATTITCAVSGVLTGRGSRLHVPAALPPGAGLVSKGSWTAGYTLSKHLLARGFQPLWEAREVRQWGRMGRSWTCRRVCFGGSLESVASLAVFVFVWLELSVPSEWPLCLRDTYITSIWVLFFHIN